MENKLGQPEADWRAQIEQLPAVRKLWGNKRKQTIEMVMHYLGFSTELSEVLRDVEYRVDANFGRMGRSVYQQAFVKVEQPILYEDGDEDYIQTYSEDSVYRTIWTPEQDVRQEIMKEIKALYDQGYLQRLKSADKTGIIDAIFIKKVGEKQMRGGRDQIDYTVDLSVSEWERIYRQATKIARMQGLTAIPFLDIDKHFCKMFNIAKAQELQPHLDKALLNAAWKGTIATCICMMKRVLSSDKKKKQEDYLSLAIFYNILSSQCEDMIRDVAYRHVKKFIQSKKVHREEIRVPPHLPSRSVTTLLTKTIPLYIEAAQEPPKSSSRSPIDAETQKKLAITIFNKIKDQCITDRKNFMRIYGIPEKTFYRRQNEYLAFKKYLHDGLKMADKDYLQALKLGDSFGL